MFSNALLFIGNMPHLLFYIIGMPVSPLESICGTFCQYSGSLNYFVHLNTKPKKIKNTASFMLPS
jgi:hypothetical protein